MVDLIEMAFPPPKTVHWALDFGEKGFTANASRFCGRFFASRFARDAFIFLTDSTVFYHPTIRQMAVKIRLKREGSKGRPYYRIVVADGRAPKEGRIIEQIGNYDPAIEGENFKLDLEKADKWIGNGAQPSDTVRSIIKKARRSAEAEA